MNQMQEPHKIRVYVPARLHFGFVDLHGGMGRRFGSLGLTLEDIATTLHIEKSEGLSAAGPSCERAEEIARITQQALRLPGGAKITVETAIPPHAGLGSGTQMALGVGLGLARLYGKEACPLEIAKLTGRGARSGIGIGAFEQGGVLLDGGNRLDDTAAEGGKTPPPIISRLPFPEEWRIVLVFDNSVTGIHGSAETRAFAALPPYDEAKAAHLCRLVLMGALPALAEADIKAFGRALNELQRIVGAHFAGPQGGVWASGKVAEILPQLEAQGAAATGQSSWGPTGFGLFASVKEAEAALKTLTPHWKDDAALRFMLCRGRNQGGLIGV